MSEPDDQRRDGHSRLVVDKGKIVVDPESMSPHKRVSLEFGVALRQIAEVMKNEARLGQPFALGLDFYKLIEVQLEQRVAVLVARAEQKAYHDGRAVADHDRRRSDALFEEGRKVIDEQRGRLTRLALYAQSLVDAIEEADEGVVGADPKIDAALAELKQELKL